MRDGEADMPAEMWAAWLRDVHPGASSDQDVGALIDAVARGNRPTELLADARAYGRLMRAQGAEPLCVTDWLDEATPT